MEIDYKKLGFKSGLEIHQQLDTNKLFCSCPSVLRNDEPAFVEKRKLHLVAGESGEVDAAAKFQVEEDKDYFYEGYDSTCLVELDEEPPHKLNEEALKIAVQISLLLNCKIIPVTQIMRKTVVNGSNTSGFQRTVMIALNGFVETSKGKVRIDSVFLEEDSCRPIKRDEKSIRYRLDRLGVPLVEITTSPDLKNAEHVKETALKIGDILRSVKVRRGIGTIRQDLNISISDSNRVEIKGFQDPKIMEICVDNEIIRQKSFLDKGEKNPSEVRNCLPDGKTEFLRPMPGSARMYPETDLPLLHIKRDFINRIKKNLPRLKSEIEKDLLKQGLDESMIKSLFKRNLFDSFNELVQSGANVRVISKALLLLPKELAKKGEKSLEEIGEILTVDVLVFVFDSLREEKIQEGDLKIVLEKIISGVDLKDSIKLERKDLLHVEDEIMKIINDRPGLKPNAYMGLVMAKMKGGISGGDAMKIIQNLMK